MKACPGCFRFRWQSEYAKRRRGHSSYCVWCLTAQRAKRRALALGTPGPHFTGAEWEGLVEDRLYCCVACGQTDVMLVPDHIIPLSKGGENAIWNIQPLCGECNASKGTAVAVYR